MKSKLFKTLTCLVMTMVVSASLFTQTAEAATATKITKAKATTMTLTKNKIIKSTISFKVNKKIKAKIKILNSKGKIIKTLSSKTAKKNKTVKFTWNGTDGNNRFVTEGDYKAKICVGNKSKIVKFKVVDKSHTHKWEPVYKNHAAVPEKGHTEYEWHYWYCLADTPIGVPCNPEADHVEVSSLKEAEEMVLKNMCIGHYGSYGLNKWIVDVPEKPAWKERIGEKCSNCGITR